MYIGELHKDEAILTAPQADTLRGLGMLQGDGARPMLDLSGRETSSSVASTAASTASSSPTSISFGGVSVVVQGGNTNEVTGDIVASAVRQQLHDMAANVQEVIVMRREG